MYTCHAAMFDMDGTLVDSLADLADSANEVMRSFGAAEHTTEEYRYFVGNGAKKLMERALPQDLAADAATVNEALTRYKKIYRERHLLTKTKPYPGIEELLAKLKEKNIPCAVLTNKPHEAALVIADKLFPAAFCAVVGDKPNRPRKPDPTNALIIAKDMGVAPSAVAYFGDSDADMLLANNAGFVPVGVLWGFRPREELSANGAKILLNHPDDIFTEINFVGK